MRYKEIDIIKGLCMLLVFFQHSILYYPVNYIQVYPICKLISESIGSFFMPCFFVVSGFLFFSSTKGCKVHFHNKIYRLLVPYISVCLLQFCIKLMLPSLAFGKFGSIKEYVYYYLFQGGDRWFLYVLFLVFVLMIPLKRYLNTSSKICFALIVLYAVSLSGILPYIYPLSKTQHFSIYFLWGYLLRIYYGDVKQHVINYWWLYTFLFVIINIAFLPYLQFMIKGIFAPLTGTVFLFAATNKLLDSNVYLVEKWHKMVSYVGKYSLQFYVMTGFVLAIARYIVVNKFDQESPWVVIPFVFFLQILFATVGVKLCERMRVTRFMFGY